MSQTKRELREERRAQREAAEHQAAAQNVRKRRLTLLGGAVAAAAVVVVIAVVVSSSGSGSAGKTASSASGGGATRSTVVAGVQEHDGVLGNPNAPYTVTEYLDLQCPICQEASTQILPDLVNNYVKTGKVKLQMRTLQFIGDDSVTAAKFAAGAKAQGKLWNFAETFYANQGEENSGYVTDAFLRSIAQASGVNAAQAFAYAKTGAATDALNTANSAAQAIGADSTPTFTVKKGDGAESKLLVGLGDLTTPLDQAISATH